MRAAFNPVRSAIIAQKVRYYMASITINVNAPRTAGSDKTITLLSPNPADYKIVEAEKGSTVVSNMKSPLSGPQLIEYSVKDITDIYPKKNGLDKSLILPSRAGKNVLVKVMENWEITHEDGKTKSIVPVSAHLVLKLPKYVEVGKEPILHLMQTLFGSAFTFETNDDTRIQALLRGGTTPNNFK